jgi:nicotinamide-nucleotide amidase
MDESLHELARLLGEALGARGWMLATAESCTGGGISRALTEVAGSSAWFECGFVTYSNASKQRLLGVSGDTLARHGAVSEATAREMARGAQARGAAHVAVAVTGIAGPTGGSAAKPVGMVCFAWAVGDALDSTTLQLQGDRAQVRNTAVVRALEGVLRRVQAAAG